MRLAITSDIHYHPPWRERVERLAALLRAQAPDVMVLAGDTGEPLALFTEGLAAFSSVGQHRAAIAGNHDVWNRVGEDRSQDLWETLLPGTAARLGYHWLETDNLILGSLGVCGTMAWYDYSGRHPDVELDEDAYEQIKAAVSNDGRYIDWPWSDREFSRRLAGDFEKRLSALQNNPDVTDIVVITHVPLFRDSLRPYDDPDQAVANAYYANLPVGSMVLNCDKVRAVFSGHVHYDRRFVIERDQHDPVLVGNVPSDYGAPAALVWEVGSLEAEALRIAPDP